jgi:hypothetical protein
MIMSRYVPRKRRILQEPQSITSQKTAFFKSHYVEYGNSVMHCSIPKLKASRFLTAYVASAIYISSFYMRFGNEKLLISLLCYNRICVDGPRYFWCSSHLHGFSLFGGGDVTTKDERSSISYQFRCYLTNPNTILSYINLFHTLLEIQASLSQKVRFRFLEKFWVTIQKHWTRFSLLQY